MTFDIELLENRSFTHMAKATFQSYDSWNELGEKYQILLQKALSNQANAYAPYSNFKVGAAIQLSDGSLVDGFNIENASYPLCVCAERVAIGNALVNGMGKKIKVLAVIGGTSKTPAFPCGACRQVMYEMEYRQGTPYKVIMASPSGKVILVDSPSELLPYSFGPDFLIEKR